MIEKCYQEVNDFLVKNLKKDEDIFFGNSSDLNWIKYVSDAWMNDQSNSSWRFELIKEFFKLNDNHRILDMASGCGTFVFYGLLNGYNTYGVDPEAWKNEFNRLKIQLYSYPKHWGGNFIRAFGECLPFKNESFDIISSYQTLEHVSDIKSCCKEMLRIVKRGGIILLHFPDYRSSFEGHYRLPWIPLFPKPLARIYLKILDRPTLGLDSINYVTKRNIIHILRQNDGVQLIDYDKVLFRKRTENIIDKFNFDKLYSLKNIISLVINIFYTYFYISLKRMFRVEKNVTVIIRKCN